MNTVRALSLIVILAVALVTPSPAQVFWSNYSPSGVTDDIWCVTYAEGTFAAVTSQGNLLTSTNGLNWNSQAIDPGVWLVSIAYGNGIWVAVGDKGTILTSSDLKTWNHAASATVNKLDGVLYNGPIPAGPAQLFPSQLVAVWVAVGENGTVVTSPDAQTWTLQPAIPGVTGFLHGAALINYSPAEISVSSNNGFLVCGANGVFLTGSPSGSFVADFPGDGFDSCTQNLEAVVAGPNITVAAGWAGTLLYGGATAGIGALSPPVFSQSSSSIPNVIFRGLTYGNGYFIAAGEQGTIMRSSDGINWLQSYSGDGPSTLSSATLLSAAFSSQLQRFVVTGTGGTILVSNPPPTVFGNVSTRAYVSSAQTLIGGFVIQGTAPRNVLIRGDGPVLAAFGVSNPLPDPVITVYNSSGTVLATNTGWTTNTNSAAIATAALETGAFSLPSPGLDSALLLTLNPGAYTVQITSAKGNSGIALFEAYTN